jgi:hypothetical protein
VKKEWFVLRSGSHANAALQREWNNHGEQAFEYQILEKLDDDVSAIRVNDVLKEKRREWSSGWALSRCSPDHLPCGSGPSGPASHGAPTSSAQRRLSPPYSVCHRQLVCSVIPASRHACGEGLPLPIDTSICRSTVTISSAEYWRCAIPWSFQAPSDS